MILTEGTSQGAPCKEYGPGSPAARNRRFLPKMGTRIGHPEAMAFPAKSGSAGFPIHKPIGAAFSRTKAAVFKQA